MFKPEPSKEISPNKDPISILSRPPPGESWTDKMQRMADEMLAKQRSDQIDEQIERERIARLRERGRQRRVLLLGQAGSGKTTLLKQFLLQQPSSVFDNQLGSYRALVYLNVLKSVQCILNAVAIPDGRGAPNRPHDQPTPRPNYPPHISALALQLQPLLDTQSILERQVEDSDTPIDSNSSNDPCRTFECCAEALIALWEDHTVQDALDRQHPSIRESPGFFMGELSRITARGYVPSQDDIIATQIRSEGVQEYCIQPQHGPELGTEWRIFDVRGRNAQRLRWAGHFQDVNIIVFLAPLGVFDEVLAEDPRVNRLEHTFLLWKEICSNWLLHDVPILLFMNKCDILKAKLESGVQFCKYMTSYKGPNEWQFVTNFLREKFTQLHKSGASNKRALHIRQTSVTDSITVRIIMNTVQDGVMRDNLKAVNLVEG